MMMTTIVLKQSEAFNYPSTHYWLFHALGLPQHYGHNLDALWDCLNGELAMPLHISWHNDCHSEGDFHPFIELFREATLENPEFTFQYIEI